MKLIRQHPNAHDAEQVEVLTALGASLQYITAHLRLTEGELKEFYPAPLTTGSEEANLKVAKTFFEMAVSKDYPQMTLAWMKMRAGWRDNSTPTNDDDLGTALDIAKEKLLTLLNRGK